MKKFLSVTLLLMFMMVAVTGCGSSGSSIKFGLVMPMTGGSGVMGVSTFNGYTLAAEEINAKGGVNGKKIDKIVTYDDTGNPQQAASGAQKFVDQKDILAIGGSANSSSTLAMIPIIDKGKLPDLVVSSSSPKLAGASPYFYRMAVQDNQVGPLMGETIIKKIGKTKVAIIYPNNDYGKGLNEALANYLTQNGGTVLNSSTYLATDQDFSATLTKIKGLNPEVIALCGTPADSGMLIKQIKQMGFTVPIIGGTGLYNAKTLEICGPAAEGMYLIGVYIDTNPDPKVQEFVAKYKAKFNQIPDGFAALAYDQMYVMADAVKRAMDANGGKVTRDSFKDALKTTNYAGVTGNVTFNDKNDWVRPYLVLTVKDGKFALLP